MFVCIYTHPLMTTENKSSISSFIPKLRIKLSMSSLPNSHLPKQQKAQAILTAYFHLLNDKYSMVFIIFFIMVFIISELIEHIDFLVSMNNYLSRMKVLYRSACISPKLLRLPCKALFLQADWGLPRRMNGILISTNYISLTKTTHAAREKRFVLASVLHKTYGLSPKTRL